MNPALFVAGPGRRARWRNALLALLVLYLGMAAYQAFKPLPEGLGQAFPPRASSHVALLTDVTWVDASGQRHSEQAVFDEALRLIGQARRVVVLDMFLFNDFAGQDGAPPLRRLSGELTAALVARRQAVPALQVLVVTDPINTVYGGLRSPQLRALQAAGVEVVVTDLGKLRAPNPAWSGLWHLCCRWLGNDADGGWLPNPFGAGKVTLRSYLALLNLNANHRKTLVVDQGEGWVGLVASANPHDGSSAHGNSAVVFEGAAALDLLRSERSVVSMSGGAWPAGLPSAPAIDTAPSAASSARVQVLTEARIRDALLDAIDSASAGDQLDLAVFYFSHRKLVHALVEAQQRGVDVRVLLDPNRDAFGREKNGIPNRQVALELDRASVPVRWCNTHGEQCHSKMLLLRRMDGNGEMVAGSANYTRRNLDDYNLETSVRVLGTGATPALVEAADYFEQSWSNRDGRNLSVAYARYADPSVLRYWRYRFMEATGLSSF